MPFDRLIRAVDTWAGGRAGADVFAQIGETSLRPAHIDWKPFLEPSEFRAKMQAATAVVAHAGTGSILTALEYAKPALVMPRRADLRETRNDHQFATAKRLEEQGRVLVAWNERDLSARLDDLAASPRALGRIGPEASPELIEALRTFIREGAA